MRWIKNSFDHLFQLKQSLLLLDIILTRDVNVVNYPYLMNLFLLKESKKKQGIYINISILKQLYFLSKHFLIDVMT